MAEDHYATLGVERGSSSEEIKQAYRKLAHQFHPDKENGDEEKFKQVNAAYQVLSDEEKRAQYDQFGQTFEGGGPGSGGPFGARVNVNFEDMGNFANVGDIFEQFFHGADSRTAPRTKRGQDIAIDTTISFIESAHGSSKDISHRLYQTCSHCHGNAAEPGTPIKDCPTCGGKGTVNTTRQTMLGVFTQSTTCSTCAGEGKQPETACGTCRGTGRQLQDRTLTVDIPAGIADGQTIRLTGKGEVPPRGGSPGDLYITVHVAPHPHLKRDGDTIHTQATISFPEAALGTTITVPTLEGEEDITIPAGTQPGDELTLRTKGFPSLTAAARRGDQIVTVNIEIPTKLSRHQRHLLKEFQQAKRTGLFK